MLAQQMTNQSCLCSNNILCIHFTVAFMSSAYKYQQRVSCLFDRCC